MRKEITTRVPIARRCSNGSWTAKGRHLCDRTGHHAEAAWSSDHSRRRHDRVAGPFDGCRVGLLETPVRIYDLSLGGCFVNSLHEQKEGTTITIKIDLPQEGWITVEAETIYRRPGFGFAVRFLNMDGETEACLERTINMLKDRQAT
jgi:hypothetical protein